MSTISEPRRCPKCGGPIPAEAPQGLCPKCLLQQVCIPTEVGNNASAKSVPPTHEELAAAFPQLEILELIGQGGMGFVFKARQPKIERLVALKILPQSLAADPAFAERFTREGRMLARLNHPNIVTIHDFGQAGGFFYLLMEFVDGVNLRQAMKVGRFTPVQALAVVPKICEALQFAHNEGILHRDIKPENILLDSKGRVKIADFGIAKLVEGADLPLGQPGTAGPAPAPNLTETGKVLGTPQYMAPEQFEHPQDVDQRADIYSLGVVFYEMLTGELPLGRFAPPSEKSTVDPRVDEVVLRTLEKQRERRTRTADEVKTQVETIATTPATDRDRLTSPAESRVAMSATITLRRPWSLIMVAALFIVTGCLAAWDISSHIGPNYRLNFGLLGLPIGIGLLRLRPRWRAVALLLPWVVLVILAVVGVMASNVGVPVRATSPTHIGSTIICLALGVMWFVWMNGILIRADVSALFQAGKRPHPWIEWAAMVGAIAMAFLVSLWTGPKPAVDVGLPSPSPAASAVSSFGPVVERTINRASTRSNFLLSFKTGELRTPFPENDKPVVDIHRWAHREGLDAAVGVLNGDNDVMTGFDMAVLPAPAQCWEELTPADAAARFEGQPAISFVILLYANGSYPETCVFKTRDGGIGILQLTGYVSEPPGVKIRYKFVDKVPAPTQTESNAVATGSWSPTLWPGEKPELRKILDEAEKLTATAHFEEALQRYLWYGGHAREFGGSASDYSLLSQWVELGRRYPKAKQALMKIRDQAAHAFQDGGGYSELFQKVAGINAQLQDDEATYALFKSIQDQDPSLAQQCYFYAESLLVKHGDYELCINCMGDPQQKYDTARHSLEMGRRFGSRTGSIPMRSAQLPTNSAILSAPRTVPPPPMPIDTSEMMRKSSENSFVGQVCQLIEILVGAGRKVDAERISDQAVADLDDARLKSAISDAEERVRKVRASPRPASPKNAVRPPIARGWASVNTNFVKPSASVERWAPSLGPGEKPNLEKIRQEANDLMAKDNFEDALQRHLWYHNHALEYDTGQTGVRLSFWLSSWVELARRYPKAKQALLEVRVLKTRELAEGRGYSALFQDVESINSYLQADDETYALFKTIEQRDPALARRCYFYIESLLVRKGEYELCLSYMGDPQSRFESSRRGWEMEKQMYERQQQFRQAHPLPSGVPGMPDRIHEADKRFVGHVRQLIEILVGAGRKADAESIRDQAVALLDDARLKSAVSDAEKKTGK